MKKCLQLATLRNTSCGMSSINRHTGLPHSTEHRHLDNACTREGSLVRVSQKLQSVETKAEAVAPVVQQSASRSQQPIHAETSVGVLGTEHQHRQKRTHTFSLLPLPSLAHQAALGPAKEFHVKGMSRHAHIHQKKRHTQSP